MYMFDLNRSYNQRCNRPIVAPIHIKHVQYSFSYQWATYQKYDWCGCESPSGYGALEWVLESADSSLESADSLTEFVIVCRLPVLTMFNISMPIQSAHFSQSVDSKSV